MIVPRCFGPSSHRSDRWLGSLLGPKHSTEYRTWSCRHGQAAISVCLKHSHTGRPTVQPEYQRGEISVNHAIIIYQIYAPFGQFVRRATLLISQAETPAVRCWLLCTKSLIFTTVAAACRHTAKTGSNVYYGAYLPIIKCGRQLQ